jgi:hypothetical protein
MVEVVLPAIGAFQRQRPSSQRLLHYWPPSSFHLFSVCSEHTGVSLPVLFNVLGVALACGLGYPHQVLVGSPHVHSSLLVPVSFAGFLIKCLRVYWQSLPQCRFAWPFSRRVDFSSPVSPPPPPFLFSDLFLFSSPPPSGGGFRASSPIFFSSSIPWRFWHIFSMASCINFSKWPAVSRRSPRC